MVYITFISYGPRGIWIINLQKVHDLSEDTLSATPWLRDVEIRRSKNAHSPTVPAIDPDFLSGHSHSLCAGAGFRDPSVGILNW